MSMAWPATISAVMPVKRVISALISTVGSCSMLSTPTTGPIRPSGVVHEGHHAEFNHLVAAVVEAGRLHVDHERHAFALVQAGRSGSIGAWL